VVGWGYVSGEKFMQDSGFGAKPPRGWRQFRRSYMKGNGTAGVILVWRVDRIYLCILTDI